MQLTESKQLSNVEEKGISVYDYSNFRDFLKDYFEYKRKVSPAYSRTAFIRKAGLAQNSRGYIALVCAGKRNLTTRTLLGFIRALGLKGNESFYFENLVYYNQASSIEEKNEFYARMVRYAKRRNMRQIELLESQRSYHSKWYYVVIRELVSFHDFQEDPAWIASQLREKVHAREIREALKHLVNLGLLRRNEDGRLVQSEPFVSLTGGVNDPLLRQFHVAMLEQTKDAIENDPYDERRASCLTIACSREKLQEFIQKIDRFRSNFLEQADLSTDQPDSVIQIGFQVFQFTAPKLGRQVIHSAHRKDLK